jgi:hypothetical protein
MVTRRDVLRRLIFTPAGVGVSLTVVSALAGCDNPTPLPPMKGKGRDDPDTQRDLETGGMPRIDTKKKKRR